jgi:hypothetical protein
MNEQRFESWEEEVQDTVRAFPYPPTPDLAGQIRRRLTEEQRRPGRPPRRLSWAAAALLILIILGSLLAVPQVRASVVEMLRLGAVRIFLVEPTPTPTPTLTPTPTPSPTPVSEAGRVTAAAPTATPTSTSTPTPSPTPLYSILDLAGETTLAEAETQVDFPIRLPAYPPDLGEPDRVFRQNMDGDVIVLVWLEPNQPDQVYLSLDQLENNAMAMKLGPEIIETITINGRQAYWVRGEHLLVLQNGDYNVVRSVGSNVLIWEADGITYRLETDLPRDEATRIAESLE